MYCITHIKNDVLYIVSCCILKKAICEARTKIKDYE